MLENNNLWGFRINSRLSYCLICNELLEKKRASDRDILRRRDVNLPLQGHLLNTDNPHTVRISVPVLCTGSGLIESNVNVSCIHIYNFIILLCTF